MAQPTRSTPALLAAIILLSACANMAQPPVAEEVATVAAGYGRAFGRVNYLEDGKEKTWGMSWLKNESLTLFVRSVPTGQMQYMQIEADGSFYWNLKAGEYLIAGYRVMSQGAKGRLTGRLATAFTVPQAGQAVYVGDLRISAGSSRYRFDVVDQYDEALKRVEARVTAGKLEAVKGLMRLEGQTGSFKRVIGICNTSWGVNCDKTYQGVEPLQPVGAAQGFPVTQNLTPLLEWKPASRPQVRYDVAIFESWPISMTLSNTERMRGTLVAYAEGLSEPQYATAVPLQPGQNYEWTVRLRDGDTVSNWSTTSYSWFAVVAWASGSGQHFGFATPTK